jgi:hypothetical protein
MFLLQVFSTILQILGPKQARKITAAVHCRDNVAGVITYHINQAIGPQNQLANVILGIFGNDPAETMLAAVELA